MKNKFVKLASTNLLPSAALRPLGNLQDLGTARQWAMELAGFALLAAALLVSSILS